MEPSSASERTPCPGNRVSLEGSEHRPRRGRRTNKEKEQSAKKTGAQICAPGLITNLWTRTAVDSRTDHKYDTWHFSPVNRSSLTLCTTVTLSSIWGDRQRTMAELTAKQRNSMKRTRVRNREALTKGHIRPHCDIVTFRQTVRQKVNVVATRCQMLTVRVYEVAHLRPLRVIVVCLYRVIIVSLTPISTMR